MPIAIVGQPQIAIVGQPQSLNPTSTAYYFFHLRFWGLEISEIEMNDAIMEKKFREKNEKNKGWKSENRE